MTDGVIHAAAPTREALFAKVRASIGAEPRERPHTGFDGVFDLPRADGTDALLFTGTFTDEDGAPVERAVVLPTWAGEHVAGRQGLVPPLRFYHDHDALLYRCALAYSLDAPLALHGHTGVGKTELVRTFAALLGAPLYRMNLHGLSTNDDIIGKLLPAGGGRVTFQDGLVTEAVRRGGLLLLEEMNATGPEVWFALHGLLDGSRSLVLVEKDNEVVPQHPRCRIFATFNPSEYPTLYPGTKELSAAYLRRWLTVRMGLLDTVTERAIITHLHPEYLRPPHSETLRLMLEVARVSREILEKRVHAFGFVLSTGTLEAWAAVALRVGPVSAAKLCFYDVLDERTKTVFREQILAYSTPWDPAGLDRGA